MPPERTVEGGCWEVLLGDGRRGMEGIRTRDSTACQQRSRPASKEQEDEWMEPIF